MGSGCKFDSRPLLINKHGVEIEGQKEGSVFSYYNSLWLVENLEKK
jgi:hypothetical protein